MATKEKYAFPSTSATTGSLKCGWNSRIIPTRCGQAPTSASKDAVVTHETTLRFSDQSDSATPDQLIVDDGGPGSDHLLKTQLLEIVS
jgi:hypothetical protein